MKKKIFINKNEIEYTVISKREGCIRLEYNNSIYEYKLKKNTQADALLTKVETGESSNIKILKGPESFQIGGTLASVISAKRAKRGTNDDNMDERMCSPMPGKIVKVLVNIDDRVSKGDDVMIMEAMKMEHTIKSNTDGLVKEIYFQEGDQVDGAIDLLNIEPE